MPCNDVGQTRNNRNWDKFLYSYITNFDSIRIFTLVEEEIHKYVSLEEFSIKFRASLYSLTRYREHLMYWPHRARNTASVLKMKNLSDEKKQKTATPKRKRGEDSDNTLQKQKDEMIPESPNYQNPHDPYNNTQAHTSGVAHNTRSKRANQQQNETLKDKREDMVSSSVQEGEQEVIF